MAEQPSRICFMVTPFGVKDTHVTPGVGPAKVDFDQLWLKQFQPLIRDLGYEPVRADADLGASIIRDMIERLTLSDLVIADVSIQNANVFYEIGVRHAARDTGCVLVAAKWSRQPFDTQSMRYEPYELAGTVITDEEVASNRASLKPRVEQLALSTTPCFELDGFPKILPERAQSFRDWLRAMNDFNTKVTALRVQPESDARKEAVLSLAKQASANSNAVIAFELLELVRDTTDWKQVIAFVEGLPQATSDLPKFQEQLSLARSKDGDHAAAIAALKQLITLRGPTSERHGLIGGRYKKLWRAARASAAPADKAKARGYLSQSIDAYEAGRVLDLNDYYASSNLPLLLRSRGSADDVLRAGRIATTVVAACERALQLGTANEWVYPTLLVAAFNAADVAKARELVLKVFEAPADWKLKSALEDLTDSVTLQPEGPVRAELEALLDELRSLIPK